MEYICIGKIINTHGIKGELKIQSYSDFDDERYRKGRLVYIEKDGQYHPVKCITYRIHKGFPLVSFEGMQNINLVEHFKECLVYVKSEDRQSLPAGEYYRTDLVGLSCVDEDGNVLGTCVEVEETNGAQNNFRIRDDAGNEFLVPHVPLFVKKIDMEERKIVIHMVEGLR